MNPTSPILNPTEIENNHSQTSTNPFVMDSPNYHTPTSHKFRNRFPSRSSIDSSCGALMKNMNDSDYIEDNPIESSTSMKKRTSALHKFCLKNRQNLATSSHSKGSSSPNDTSLGGDKDQVAQIGELLVDLEQKKEQMLVLPPGLVTSEADVEKQQENDLYHQERQLATGDSIDLPAVVIPRDTLLNMQSSARSNTTNQTSPRYQQNDRQIIQGRKNNKKYLKFENEECSSQNHIDQQPQQQASPSNQHQNLNRIHSDVVHIDLDQLATEETHHASRQQPSESNPQDVIVEPGLENEGSRTFLGINSDLTEEQVEIVENRVQKRMKLQTGFLVMNLLICVIIYLLCMNTIKIQHLLKVVEFLVLIRLYNIISKRYESKLLKAFTILNWVCVGFYFVVWDLTLTIKLDWIITYSAFPGAIVTLFFWMCSPSPNVYKDKTMILMERTIVWLQAILLGIRLDGVELPWLVALLPIYCGLITLLLISLVFFCQFFGVLLKVVSSPYLTQSQNTFGSAWNLLLSLLSVQWMLLLMNIQKGLKEEMLILSYDSMLIGSVGFVIFGLLYQRIFKDKICIFMSLEIQNELGLRGSESAQALEDENSDEAVNNTLRVENFNSGSPYVWMISSTFFSNTMFSKKGPNKREIQEWKTKIKRRKSVQRGGLKGNSSSVARKLKMQGSTQIELKNKAVSLFNLDGIPKEESPVKKVHLSENDISIHQDVGVLGVQPVEENDNVCIICCDRNQEAVMKDCGHGGFCYPCAYDAWHKNNTCPICRNDVGEILIIKTIDALKVGKILKVSKKVSQQEGAASSQSDV